MKNICLTFDDGIKSHYEFVRPLLKNNNLKGTFFICVENPWIPQPEKIREALMSVTQHKEMD